MTWKYPKHNLKDPNVIGMDDVNENFRAVVEEVSGDLNEHNWKRGSFTSRDSLADNAGIVLHNVVVEVDPNIIPDVSPNAQFINLDRDWQEIDGLEINFNTTGGTHWILASMEVTSAFDQGVVVGGVSAPGSGAGRWGLQFAVTFNGAVLAQSIIGSGDLSNDEIATFRLPSPKKIGFITINTPAPSSKFLSIVSEAVIEVPPGNHTVRVVCAPPQAVDFTTGATMGTKCRWIGSRELIVAQLLR